MYSHKDDDGEDDDDEDDEDDTIGAGGAIYHEKNSLEIRLFIAFLFFDFI